MAAVSTHAVTCRARSAAKSAVATDIVFVSLRVLVAVVTLRRRPQHRELPRRVISLMPATTEMLFAMGAGDRVVGVSNYDRFPPEVERLPRVGGLLDPNVERILSLRPDLVIVYDTQTDLRQQLERAHVPDVPLRHRGLADITQTMRALGARVGVEGGGRRRGGAHRAAAGRRSARASRAARGRRRCWSSAASRARCGNIDASGGVRIPARHARARRRRRRPGGRASSNRSSMSTEIDAGARAGGDHRAALRRLAGDATALDADRRAWDALPSVPAVQNHNSLHCCDGEEFVVPGPRVVVAAERFARRRCTPSSSNEDV